MFLVVVAIPSTFFVPSEMRYYGQSGFSAYQVDSEFHVNVPKEIWTAACCAFHNKDDGRAGTKTVYDLFGKLPCKIGNEIKEPPTNVPKIASY